MKWNKEYYWKRKYNIVKEKYNWYIDRCLLYGDSIMFRKDNNEIEFIWDRDNIEDYTISIDDLIKQGYSKEETIIILDDLWKTSIDIVLMRN